MSQQERTAWDERFHKGDHGLNAPDPFLLRLQDFAALLPSHGRALDMACGTGRNAVWLAQQGWNVTALDISMEGLRRTRQNARQGGVQLRLVCDDLECPPFRESCFDLVICFFFLDRNLFSWLRTVLRSGGWVVYKTYIVDQQRFAAGPKNKDHLLQPQELLHAFSGFHVWCYEETVTERAVARIIAQKPGQ